jgi:hypothetical protein
LVTTRTDWFPAVAFGVIVAVSWVGET